VSEAEGQREQARTGVRAVSRATASLQALRPHDDRYRTADALSSSRIEDVRSTHVHVRVGMIIRHLGNSVDDLRRMLLLTSVRACRV